MDLSSEDEAGSQQGDGRSKAATSADSSKWPISVNHSKPSECYLCASKSMDSNPLVQEVGEAADAVQWRPWAKYRKLPQHCVRVSEGKVCLPCFNVFRLLGKHKKYKKTLNYYQHISQKTNQAAQNEHKDFLAALKHWLKQHQENPDKFKLKSKDDLLKTQRELVISKKQGGRMTAPKKQFILSSHWDTARHGEWDPAKEVDHWIDGAFRKGVWRNIGEEGVYNFEAYEDTGLEERVVEDDGQQEMFAEEAFQAKKQAALEAMQKQAKDRDAASVKAKESEMSFADLVHVVSSLGKSSSGSAEVPVADGPTNSEGKGAESGSDVTSSSNSSSEEEEQPTGLDLLLSYSAPKGSRGDSVAEGLPKRPQTKAKAKEASSAKTPVAAVKEPTKRASAQSHRPAKVAKVSNPTTAGGSEAGMLSLDGRASRTLKTLEAAIQQAKEKISEVSFNDLPQSATQMKAFRAEASDRIAKLTSVAKKAKETGSRVGKSNNKDSFEKQLDELQELGNLAAACAKLLTNASASSLDADAYISAYNEASGGGAKLGPLYTLKLVVAQGQKLFLYGKYTEYCEAFLASSEPIQALSQSLGEKDAAKHCALEVENRMLASLRAIPASELSLLKPGKATRDLGSEAPRVIECLDLAGAIEDACGKDGFMASELAVAACTVGCLLGQENVAALCQQVEALQDTANKDLDSIPALQRFFLQHDTGKAFFSIAQLRVEQGDKERVFQEKLATLRQTVSHLTAWPKQSPPDAESGVMAVEKRVVPAVDALAEVKKTTFFSEGFKKQKKHEQTSSSLFAEFEKLEKLLSTGSCDLVRLVCRENMENHVLLACMGWSLGAGRLGNRCFFSIGALWGPVCTAGQDSQGLLHSS